MTLTSGIETGVPSLYASAPTALSFDPSLHIRAFLLRRDRGNVLMYGAPGVDGDTFAGVGGLARAYLHHFHEAELATDLPGVPLFVHEADRADVARVRRVRATFAHRHTFDGDLEVIPTPGHTPGATVYLWDNGQHRFLFSGDTIYLIDGEWVAAVFGGSDRAAYLDSLALIRELDYDVLVPWAATAGQPYYAVTSNGEARRRVGAIIDRVARGSDQ